MERVGLTSNDGTTVLAEMVTADGSYRYQLFADDVVAIQKMAPGGWKTAYVFRMGVCPCTGHQYRADCKHKATALSLIAWGHENLRK